MKKISFFLLALVLSSSIANAQLIPADTIFADTTFTLANSPYQVDTILFVYDTASVVIEPGVTMLFDDNAGFFVDENATF